MSSLAVEQLFTITGLSPVLFLRGLGLSIRKSFSRVFPEVVRAVVHKLIPSFTSLKLGLYKLCPSLITKTSYLKTNSSRKGIL